MLKFIIFIRYTLSYTTNYAVYIYIYIKDQWTSNVVIQSTQEKCLLSQLIHIYVMPMHNAHILYNVRIE